MPKANGQSKPLEGKLLARVKAEYLSTTKSVRVLAAEFSVSEDALGRLVTKERWKALRAETAGKTAEKLVEKISTAQANEAAERTREHLRVWSLLLKEAEKRLTMMDPILGDDGEVVRDRFGNPLMTPHVKDAKHLDAIANTVKKATEGERLALGMDKVQSNPLDDADFNGGSLWEGVEDEPPGAGF
jgi:hypothetical protein